MAVVCPTGKVPYRSKNKAQRALAVGCNRRTKSTDGNLVVTYLCAFCGVWHLGHPPGTLELAKRRVRKKLPKWRENMAELE